MLFPPFSSKTRTSVRSVFLHILLPQRVGTQRAVFNLKIMPLHPPLSDLGQRLDSVCSRQPLRNPPVSVSAPGLRKLFGFFLATFGTGSTTLSALLLFPLALLVWNIFRSLTPHTSSPMTTRNGALRVRLSSSGAV